MWVRAVLCSLRRSSLMHMLVWVASCVFWAGIRLHGGVGGGVRRIQGPGVYQPFSILPAQREPAKPPCRHFSICL